MKNANPGSLGVFTFGLSCLVVGALFAGWFGYLFILLMPLALYIAFKEQLIDVWPKPSGNEFIATTDRSHGTPGQ